MKMSKIEKKFINSKQHAERNLELIQRLFSRIDLNNTSKVLEIGCGVGIVSAHLSNNLNMDVTGIDVDPEQISIAKTYNKENDRLKFITADSTKLPFEADQFDMVLSLYVLHHIGKWKKALEEISRVLRQNGYYIFCDLAYSKFTTRMLGPIVKNYGIYTIDEISHCLETHEFRIIHSEEPEGTLMRNYSVIYRKMS
jgi:ubiquinone/menaquinone biosynthesis C-methylase UbiE